MRQFTLAAAAVLLAVTTAAAQGAVPKRVVIKTSSGGAPLHISIGDGAVWVGTHRANVLYRINPRTNTKKTIQIAQNTCHPTVFGAGFAFQSGCGDTYMTVQINPRTNRIVRHIPGVFGVIGAGSLWLVEQTGKVNRFDPHSGVRLATIDPGIDLTQNGGPIGLLDGGMWIASDTAVSRIDVETNKVTDVIPLPGGKPSGGYPGGYLYGGYGTVAAAKLWLSDAAGIYEVDPAKKTATLLPIRVNAMTDFGDVYVTKGAGSIWARIGDTTVVRIDPSDGHILETFAASGGGGGIAVGYGSLWTANAGIDTVWRVGVP